MLVIWNDLFGRSTYIDQGTIEEIKELAAFIKLAVPNSCIVLTTPYQVTWEGASRAKPVVDWIYDALAGMPFDNEDEAIALLRKMTPALVNLLDGAGLFDVSTFVKKARS